MYLIMKVSILDQTCFIGHKNHWADVIKSGFKTLDQVQGQGVDRSGKCSPPEADEHLPEVCNAAIGP
jgi:hypothetical protein